MTYFGVDESGFVAENNVPRCVFVMSVFTMTGLR